MMLWASRRTGDNPYTRTDVARAQSRVDAFPMDVISLDKGRAKANLEEVLLEENGEPKPQEKGLSMF